MAETTSPVTTSGGGGGSDRVFLRKASGLIKTASTTDVFIFNLGLVSVGIGVGGLLLYGPSVYPGGNLILGCLFAGVFMSAIAFGMLTWTVTIPRSGGIYAFGSRILPPPIAFMLSAVETIAWLFFCGIAAYWVVTIGLIPMFTVLAALTGSGAMTDIADFLAKKGITFLIGTLILLLAGGILGGGMRRYFFSQKIVVTVASLGTLLLIAVMLFGSRGSFVQHFNSAFGPDVTYDKVIASAKKGGWNDPGFDFWQTLKASNWAFLPLVGAAFSISIGGEIKSGMRGQSRGMFGAIWLSTIAFIIAVALGQRVFGYDFLGAVGYNSLGFNTDPNAVTTPTTPWVTLLAGILANSSFLTVLISMGFICWIWMWIPGMQAYGERAMIAWAFDRVAPGPLGRVSDRYHSPVTAIGVATVITVGFLALFVFSTYFATLVLFVMIALGAWAVVLAAGIAFPYKRPDIYEKSPIADRKVMGLPLMTFACSIGFVAAVFYFFVLFFDEFAAGHDPGRLALMAATFAGGLVFFLAMKAYRKSKGVDVNLAFKEIPIE
ncbi:MAG: basic amino acid/polyamine antiporter, family [Solirubrobacteraceae bacterium]|jgi:amino acid transporter|nr:basic amino acid/polyamine antiporter, family [Solirubrobacteraceae bacterium]